MPTSGAFVFKDRPCVGLLPYLGSGLVTDVRISDLDGFGLSHPFGLELRLEERRQVTGFPKRWDSNALERGYCLVECHWVVLGRYLGTRLDGRLALQWWPLTSGRNRTIVDRSLLHCWRCADLVFHPASFMAQPKALDCRSLRLRDYRSRVLDSPPQRCSSSVPWVYWVLL